MRRVSSVFISFLLASVSIRGQIVEPYPGDGDAEPVRASTMDEMFHPGQVFAPNAANLGVYGKIPVNYYTGSADVQIPLTELKGKDCTQPVYLSYRTGGHKVNEMPGPFGLGWTLHAGGCINRIVNGEKDEMSRAEKLFLSRFVVSEYIDALDYYGFSTPGYLYHPDQVQTSGYRFAYFNYPRLYDMAPDEFQICAEGLSGSFYIGSGGDPYYVSKTPDTCKIEYETETIDSPVVLFRAQSNAFRIEVNYFTYISKIIITDGKGIRYTFGGDMSSIDFSYAPSDTPSISYTYQQDTLHTPRKQFNEMVDSYWETVPSHTDPRIIATANSWHLVSKEYPMSGEKIAYYYEKKGFPVIISDVNSRMAVITNDASQYGLNGGLRYSWEFLSFTDDRDRNGALVPRAKTNIRYTLLNPSYLMRIKSERTSETVEFTYKNLDGLAYNPDNYEFAQAFSLGEYNSYEFLSSENKFYTATGVSSRQGLTLLQYSRDLTGDLYGGDESHFAFLYDRPLSFLDGRRDQEQDGFAETPDSLIISPATSVVFPEENHKYRIHLERVILSAGTSARREYRFRYNETRLPGYTAKVSDHWGYYCGRSFESLLSTKYDQNVYMSDQFCQHGVNEWYNTQRAPSPWHGLAESLEQVIYPTGGSTTFVFEPHQYDLIAEVYPQRSTPGHGVAGGFRIQEIRDSLGAKAEVRSYTYNSSGILAGKPLYGTVAYNINAGSPPIEEFDSIENWAANQRFQSRFRLASENYINQIPATSGSHIAYSAVTEHLGDGSSITYRFTDMAEFPDMPAESYHSFRARDIMNPYTSCDIARGLLKEATYRTSDGVLVRKEEMTYRDSVCTSSNYGDLMTGLYSYIQRIFYPSDSPFYYSWEKLYSLPSDVLSGISNGNMYESIPYFIRLSRCYIFGRTPYLVEKRETVWDENGQNPVSVTTEYKYNDRNQLISEKTTGATETERLVRWSGDLSGSTYSQMSDAGMVGYPVEETEIMDGKVVSSVLHAYALTDSCHFHHVAEYRSDSPAGITSAEFLPYDGNAMDASYGNHPEETYIIDGDHNLRRKMHRDSSSTTVIWGYDGVYPVMLCSARDTAAIAFYGFEEGVRNYSYAASVEEGFQSMTSHSGPFHIQLPDSSVGSNAIIDYMVKGPSGLWEYRRVEPVSGQISYTIDEGAYPIDNIRVYPKGEEVVSYTWFPGIGVRSSMDAAGNTAFYVYDAASRLKAVYDAYGNPVSGYYYKFATVERE